jgi:ferredoxin
MPPIIELRINGKATRVEADPERTLLSVLRDDLGLTGAKYGCGEGQCGACTVLVDETPIRSCRAKLGNVAGKAIATIEGLEKDGKLHPVQEAFLEFDAMQCGYCTCGIDHGRGRFPAKESRTFARRNRPRHAGPYLPLRNLSPDHRGRRQGRSAIERTHPMSRRRVASIETVDVEPERYELFAPPLIVSG